MGRGASRRGAFSARYVPAEHGPAGQGEAVSACEVGEDQQNSRFRYKVKTDAHDQAEHKQVAEAGLSKVGRRSTWMDELAKDGATDAEAAGEGPGTGAKAPEDGTTAPAVVAERAELREQEIEAAVKFLGIDKVRESSFKEQERFLVRKGLSPEEVREAFRLHSQQEAPTNKEATGSTNSGTSGSTNGGANGDDGPPVTITNEEPQIIKEASSSSNSRYSGGSRGTNGGDRLVAAITNEEASQRRRRPGGDVNSDDDAVVRREAEARQRLEKRLAEAAAAEAAEREVNTEDGASGAKAGASASGPERRIALDPQGDLQAYTWEQWNAVSQQNTRHLWFWDDAPIASEKRVMAWEGKTDGRAYTFLEYHQYTKRWSSQWASSPAEYHNWLLSSWKGCKVPSQRGLAICGSPLAGQRNKVSSKSG